MGLMPQVTNWMDNRLQNVVLPDEDGPAISTTRVPWRWAICSAMEAIFFSCRASLTLMRPVVCPDRTASLKSPTVLTPRMRFHLCCSLKMSNILSWRISAPSSAGFWREGRRSNAPSKYFSSPKRVSCEVLMSNDP